MTAYPFQTGRDQAGTLGFLKGAICSGEILWGTKPFYAVAFPNSTRQYLNVVDKSKAALEGLFVKIFGTQPPPLVVPLLVKLRYRFSFWIPKSTSFCLHVSLKFGFPVSLCPAFLLARYVASRETETVVTHQR